MYVIICFADTSTSRRRTFFNVLLLGAANPVSVFILLVDCMQSAEPVATNFYPFWKAFFFLSLHFRLSKSVLLYPSLLWIAPFLLSAQWNAVRQSMAMSLFFLKNGFGMKHEGFVTTRLIHSSNHSFSRFKEKSLSANFFSFFFFYSVVFTALKQTAGIRSK